MRGTIAKLKTLPTSECYELLADFKKAQLLDLAKAANITVNKQGNKDVITGQIVNHYGYSKLHNRIAQRPAEFR
jgi:hypothetical protein